MENLKMYEKNVSYIFFKKHIREFFSSDMFINGFCRLLGKERPEKFLLNKSVLFPSTTFALAYAIQLVWKTGCNNNFRQFLDYFA